MTAFSYRDVSTMRAKALMVQLQYWLIHTGCVCPPAMALAMVECRMSSGSGRELSREKITRTGIVSNIIHNNLSVCS